jgi:hypothetical protein
MATVTVRLQASVQRGKLRAVPVRRGSEEVTAHVSLVWAFA